jgi:hypothetical protein
LRPEPTVLAFIAGNPLDELYVGSVTLAEPGIDPGKKRQEREEDGQYIIFGTCTKAKRRDCESRRSRKIAAVQSAKRHCECPFDLSIQECIKWLTRSRKRLQIGSR